MAKKTTPPITKLPDTSQFDALIKQSKNEAINAGVLPDYEAAQEEAGGRIKEYGGIDAMYSIEAPDFYDAYEDYVDRNTLRGGQFDTDALNAIRAENQSNWEQTGNALGRLAVNIVPQIIGSAAAMIDIPGYFSAEEAANNAIVNWADSIKQQTNEALPIYEENPGGSMQMGDFAWWISRGEGLVESIASFAATGMGAGKLASLGGKALARGLASAAMNAKTAKTIGGAVGQLGAATMMNQAEAVLEATQVYKTTYDRALSKGKTDIQAKEEAARAAATTMNINRANILLNLTSAKAFLTPMKATRNLLTAPTTLGTIGKVVGEGAQEALEETINLVGQKAGEAKGRGEKDYMKKGMEAIGTMEGLEAAFLGAIGGVGQTAITSALQSSKYGPGAVVDAEGNKISYNENLRQQYQKQQKVIEELKANGVKVTDALMNVKERAQFEEELEVARIMGDNAKVAELQEKLFETTALKAFESGTTDILIEQLKEEAAQDPNVVGPEYIANAQQALKDLKQLEDVYNNFEEYSNVGEIFSNRAAQQRVNRQANVTNTLTKNAQVSYAQKVRDIAQKYNFTEEYDQINKVEGEEVGRTKQTREVPLNYVLSDLDNNQGDTEENQKTYDKFLKEVKNTPEYQMYNGYQAQTEVVNAQLEQIQKDFQEMTSPAYQQKFAEKQAEKAKLKELNAQLVNATSIPEIEKLKAQTKDAVFQGLADGKIAEIEKSNAAEAKRKQTELTMRQLRAKVATATNDNYDEIQKSIEDADISQANKDQLRVEHTARLENLNNPQAAVTNPLSAFQQGDNLDEEEATAAAVQQNNKALSTKLPEDLPTPDEETTQVEQQVINAAEAIIQNDKSTVVGQDENGNLVYSYSKSAEGHNKGAFLSREFNQTETLGTVSREEIEDNLTDNTKVLDPDELTAGTKLIISIDHDYEGDKYDPESATREVISWPARLAELRALAAERNVDLTALPEYIAEVPIKVTTEDGQTVFYVHDNAWYKAENLDNTPEAIAEDKRKNFVVRANVVKKGVVKSQVEYKSFGRLFKTADGKSIPLTDAMPDENLIVAVGKDGGYDYGNATGLPADATIVNKQETQAGRPYAVVKVGPKEYMALPLERARLSDEVVDSIIFAIEAHLRNDENDPAVQSIANATGIDITSTEGLAQYVNQFTYLFPLDKSADIENLLMQGGSKSALKSSTPIITIGPTGIEFGRPGLIMNKYVDAAGVEQQRYGVTISQNFENTAFGKRLNKDSIAKLRPLLKKAVSNVRVENLKLNTPSVLIINAQGDTSTTSYLDTVKKSHKSNVISANIGTEENPKWVYTIQPTILFDTKFAGKLNTQQTAAAKTKPAPVPQTPTVVNAAQPVSKEEAVAETPVAVTESADPIANLAEEILDTFSENISVVDGFITNIEDGTLSLKQLQEYGFETKDIALQAFNMAKKLHAERSKQVKTITLPNGKTVTINGNTKDSEAISDDSFDDALVTIPEDQVNTIVAEVSNLVISGIDPRTQDSVVSFIAADIMKQALASKEKGGKKSVETLPIFNKHKESFVELAKFYRENGLVNKAARLEALVDQFPKLQSIVNQYMATLTTGKVDENLELNEAEESVGLEKTVYSDDWTFTINSKSTASADLRKFFSFVEDRNEDGEVVENSLGFPEIIPFDQVYDTLHMILADKPADLDTMINSLELYKQAFPWLETVIENIENSPERIQNEFVSDMSKHHISMKYITWAKDKNGKYTLQRWSSNASSIEERLRNSWNSNLRAIGSNLVYTNEEDQYFFNPEVADDLIQQAAAWEKDPQAVTNDELAQWLGNFGIVLTDKTYEDLRAGKYNNSGKKPFTTLFTASTGLVKVLASELKKATSQQISVDEFNILKDSAVKALARLDALNTVGNYSNSFRAGGKTIYSYGNNNYLVNRMRDLTAYDGENKEFINQELIDELKSVSFTQDSLWLKNLTDEGPLGEFTRQNMGLDYLSLEALKQQNSRSRDNRKLNNLNTDEHEIVKLGMFFNGSKKIIDGKVYRQVSYFYPTMSDKTTMLVVNALAEDITVTTDGLAKANLESLYQALIMPEINRMRGYKTNKVAGYEPNYFYFLPGLNELNVEVNGVEQSFRDLVLSDSQTLFEPEVKQQLFDYLQETFDQIVEQKLADWDRLNVGKTIKDSNNRTTDEFTFLDKSYMSTHAKGIKNQKVYHAAADYVYNTLIANSEMMKLFTGDPALYAKFKKDATLQENLEASFINMGKRLAGDIAPGVELADSANNKYFQVFLKDKKVDSNNLKDSEQKAFFEKIEKDYGKNYKNIEGSDAQEYTTWKEHLYVLRQLGRLTAAQFDTLNQKLTQQSLGKINASTKLTFDEVGLVLQPMKPVYVGNLLSKQENVDRRVYVKSSGFPLIPEFTTGFQLDKVRQALEKFEQDNSTQLGPDGSQKFVRASFGTANKVGAVTNAVDVFDNDGNVIDDLSISAENVLELPRSNFRIQQDVPYKREKDQINVGTQERKLLFVNLLDVKVNSKKTGKDLLNTYNQAYEDLFKYAQEKLAKRLGLIEEITGNNVLEEFNTMTVDPEVVNTVATKMDEISKIKSPIKKQTALQEFEDEIGQDNLERINFINQNFDSIVESLINSKINFFFDENNEFKNCD